jgi:hypothetical protein
VFSTFGERVRNVCTSVPCCQGSTDVFAGSGRYWWSQLCFQGVPVMASGCAPVRLCRAPCSSPTGHSCIPENASTFPGPTLESAHRCISPRWVAGQPFATGRSICAGVHIGHTSTGLHSWSGPVYAHPRSVPARGAPFAPSRGGLPAKEGHLGEVDAAQCPMAETQRRSAFG